MAKMSTISNQTYDSGYFNFINFSISESNKPLIKSAIIENILFDHQLPLTKNRYFNFEKDLTGLIILIEEELETK